MRVQISNGNSLRRYIKHACVLTTVASPWPWRNMQSNPNNGDCSRRAWLQACAASKACAACSPYKWQQLRLDNCRAPTAQKFDMQRTEYVRGDIQWVPLRTLSFQASPSNDERRLLYIHVYTVNYIPQGELLSGKYRSDFLSSRGRFIAVISGDRPVSNMPADLSMRVQNFKIGSPITKRLSHSGRTIAKKEKKAKQKIIIVMT